MTAAELVERLIEHDQHESGWLDVDDASQRGWLVAEGAAAVVEVDGRTFMLTVQDVTR